LTNIGFINGKTENPLFPQSDTCYGAMVIDNFSDCPEVDGCITGRFSDFEQPPVQWSQLAIWPSIKNDVDTSTGVWFRFTAKDRDLEVFNCLNDDFGALLAYFVFDNCTGLDMEFNSPLPITNDADSVGRDVFDVGLDYYLYLYSLDGTQDSFSICVDNDQINDLPPFPTLSWCEADLLCGISELDSHAFSMKESNVNEPNFACSTTFHDPHWFAFVAGSNTATLSFLISECISGAGVQIEAYLLPWTDSTSTLTDCVIDGVSDPLLDCMFFQIPQQPGTMPTLSFPTEIGDIYGIVIDGWGEDLCEIEILVNEGAVMPMLDTITPLPPVWEETSFPFLGDTLCSGSANVLFTAPETSGISRFRWTMNGVSVNDGLNSESVLLDFPVAGTYQICIQKTSPCSTSDTACIEVIASDFIPENISIDTSIICAESLFVDARTFEGFEQKSGIVFSLPDGRVLESDTFRIYHTGTHVISTNTCSDSIFIHVNDPFVITDSIIFGNCFSSEIQLSTELLDDVAYLWSTGDTTASVDGLTFGWHDVTITAQNIPCNILRSYFIDVPQFCKSNITGSVLLQDTTECNTNKLRYPAQNQKIEILPTGIIASTDSSGNYTVEVTPGIFEVRPIVESYQIVSCPASVIDTIDNVGDTSIVNFEILDTNTCFINVDIASSIARAGMEIIFSIVIKNNGSSHEDVAFFADLDDQYVVSSAQSILTRIHSISGGNIFWEIPLLAPGEMNLIRFRVELKTSTLPGTELLNRFSFYNDCIEDEVFQQTVRASFDPNDKRLRNAMGRESANIFKSDSILNYIIRFQNTGDDTAFRVVITDELSEFLDHRSFTPGPSSHNYTWRILPNRIAEFTFDPILLPYKSIDDEGSQGFISFSIQPHADFMISDTVLNRASIFFDFNPPIYTNTVVSEYTRPTTVDLTEASICVGDSFEYDGIFYFSSIILSDTFSLFDEDSVSHFILEVGDEIRTELDTLVIAGSIIFGKPVFQDTTFSITYSPTSLICDSVLILNVEIVSSIDLVEQPNINIYPNPFGNELAFESNRFIESINLYNTNGQSVFVQRKINSTNSVINTSQIHPGFYVAEITVGGQVYYRKVLKL